MEELKGLISGSEIILDKIYLVTNKYRKGELSKEIASKQIDLLARELSCLAGTIKQVAYEIGHPLAGVLNCK